jgi:hypothetical protein
MNEEAAELAEQEELMRQEQNMRDLQAQQQVEEARGRKLVRRKEKRVVRGWSGIWTMRFLMLMLRPRRRVRRAVWKARMRWKGKVEM